MPFIEPFCNCAYDSVDHSHNGFGGIVVGRNYKVNITRITVRINDGEHRNAELLRFCQGNVLFHHVHDENGRGDAIQIRNRTQVFFKLGALTAHLQAFSLRQGCKRTIFFHFVNGAHFTNRLTNGRKIGQHASRPALGYIGHTHGLHALSDRLFGLLFGRDKHDFFAALGNLLQCCGRFINFDDGLVKIKNMNALLLSEDVRGHVGIPLALEVAILGPRFKQLFKRNSRHDDVYFPRLSNETVAENRSVPFGF